MTKKLIEELSQKNKLLLEKDPAYQNDIAYVMLQSSYLIWPKNKTFHFELRPQLLNQCSWPNKFYHTIEKKLEIVKSTLHILT